MKAKSKNELYCLVDESFISDFDAAHQSFMKNVYYKHYSSFINHIGCRKLSKREFFTNMHRRRVKLYQLCCPFCGTIEIIPKDRNWKNNGDLNYCFHCGRSSAMNVCFEHLARFIRFSKIVYAGMCEVKEEHDDIEDWLIGYEVYQMELVTLVSIIEVVFRDYFEALLFINDLGIRNNKYIQKSIDRSIGNDFMQLEKANTHYKKAFNIDLKTLIDIEVWNDLIDIVNLRNIFIHNNGRIDDKFKNTSTYERLRNNVQGDLYCLKKEDINKYFKDVFVTTLAVTEFYNSEYIRLRRVAIANHYFNVLD